MAILPRRQLATSVLPISHLNLKLAHQAVLQASNKPGAGSTRAASGAALMAFKILALAQMSRVFQSISAPPCTGDATNNLMGDPLYPSMTFQERQASRQMLPDEVWRSIGLSKRRRW